jgi:hypothetical protein
VSAVPADTHQSSVSQHLQVLRDRTEGDVEVGGKVARPRFTVPTQPEDLSAAWVGDDLDHVHDNEFSRG